MLDISVPVLRGYKQQVTLKDLEEAEEGEPVFPLRAIKPQTPDIAEILSRPRESSPEYLTLEPSKLRYHLINIDGINGISASSEAVYSFRPTPEPVRYLKLDVCKEVKPFLSTQVQELLEGLANRALIQARQNFLPIRRLRVALRRYPSEDFKEIVLEVVIQSNSKQAIAFWEALEARVEEWKVRLPSRLAEILDSLSISVVWCV
jgi:hypothetical protein